MVKRLAPEREFMSSSPTGAVYFFSDVGIAYEGNLL